MGTDISHVVKHLQQERGMSEDLILRTIENTLIAAYKHRFGKCDHVVVQFDDENTEVKLFEKRWVVDADNYYEELTEIELDEARKLNPDADIGDEILVEIDPKLFDLVAVQSAKQTAHQSIREIQKDSLYSEFKDKVGELIIGYYQREKNGNIYLDLGKVEGILPKKYQSPNEVYHVNDRIKALITEVNKDRSALQIVLSRSSSDFVKAIFELEVPEIYDKIVVIHKIVREAGKRTKLAVYSNRDDVDPVGACVGLKGVRIQTVIRELENEKIDILKYDPDPRRFIKNALSPAEVREVIILDESKHQALAVVSDNMLSLAIGKEGLNVRLANRLVDWNIDVKTESQFAEMDIAAESRRAVSQLFGEDNYTEEFSRISELPGVDANVTKILLDNGIDFIEDFLNQSQEDLEAKGISASQLEELHKLIEEYVEIEIVSGDETESEEQDTTAKESEEISDADEYECPECGAKITVDMTTCPSCGIGLSFEYEEEE